MRAGRKISLYILTALIAFGGGVLYAERVETGTTLVTTAADDVPAGVDLTPVWKAWRLLEQAYVPATTTAPLTPQDRVWGMLEGLAAAYNDPYTVFMPPRESARFADDIRGTFGGVGIEIGQREGILTVIAPLKGTPGEAAGLMAGDFIVEVDGESTRTMSIDEAIDRIRGEVGTDVVLTIAREGEAEYLTIPVTRATIEIPTTDTVLRDDGVFVISLYNFGATADTEYRAALRAFLASGSDKLILDLRGNPGGYLESAVELSSMFLPLGDLVVTEDHGKSTKEHRSKGYNVIGDTPLVILVDQGSASASEIVAGALRAHNRATLIGKKTYGKGSVQELMEVTPDTSLKVTVARWLTPDGISISDNGLTPDHEVAYTRDDAEAERDPQLDAAVAFLLTGSVPPAASATSSSAQLLTE